MPMSDGTFGGWEPAFYAVFARTSNPMVLLDGDRRQVDVNVHGVILGCKLALPGMLARGSGHIVNVASAAAKVGVPREAVYAATKHAVLGLSESLRAELRGTGVELSVVLPGLVRTEEFSLVHPWERGGRLTTEATLKVRVGEHDCIGFPTSDDPTAGLN